MDSLAMVVAHVVMNEWKKRNEDEEKMRFFGEKSVFSLLFLLICLFGSVYVQNLN
jgi:hypothetical protein